MKGDLTKVLTAHVVAVVGLKADPPVSGLMKPPTVPPKRSFAGLRFRFD